MTSTYTITPKMFHTLVADAIAHTTLAGNPDYAHPGASARAAVLTCAAIVECAANICITDASLPFMRNDTPLDKLRSHAIAKGKTIPNDNDPAVQPVTELRQWRNKLIHHKAQSTDLNNVASSFPGHAIRIPAWDDQPSRPQSRTRSLVAYPDALSALKATVAFLKYAFIGQLGLSQDDLYKLMAVRVRVGPHGSMGEGHIVRRTFNEGLNVLADQGIDVAFLRPPQDIQDDRLWEAGPSPDTP